MEERKRVAKELNKKFFLRTIVWYLAEVPFILLMVVGCKTGNSALIWFSFMLIAVLYFILGALTYRYMTAAKIMVSRVLVGKEISEDPVKEGLERYKKYGDKAFRAHYRSCGVILYGLAKGAMELASIFNMIPVLKNFTALYKRMVRKAYDNTAKLICTYQLGVYEDGDNDQMNDLITYFVQDGKNFLLRTVATEVKGYFMGCVWSIIAIVGVLAFLITQSPLAGFIGLGVLMLAMVWSIILDYNDDFNILCEYIEYVQTHELDTNLKTQIMDVCKAGDNVLNIRDAVYNPTEYTLKKAVNSATELIDQYEEGNDR